VTVVPEVGSTEDVARLEESSAQFASVSETDAQIMGAQRTRAMSFPTAAEALLTRQTPDSPAKRAPLSAQGFPRDLDLDHGY
jgi:hypothetical protein